MKNLLKVKALMAPEQEKSGECLGVVMLGDFNVSSQEYSVHRAITDSHKQSELLDDAFLTKFLSQSTIDHEPR